MITNVGERGGPAVRYRPGGSLAGSPRHTTGALMLRYVVEREKLGRIEKRTASNIRYVLSDFANHCPDQPASIQRRHVKKWLERKEHLAPGTLRLRLSMLRGFFKWCVNNNHITRDPTAGIESPAVPEGPPKRFHPEEARAVAHAANGHEPRKALVVALMLQEGLRRKEIAELLIEDIDFADRSFLVRGKGGKGGQTDAMPITSETWTLLGRYLAAEHLTHGPLIQNRWRPGHPVSPERISDMVTEAMIDAGVKQRGDNTRTPHSCRHTAAHDMLTRTRDVRAVQKALRHKTVSSTEIYLRGHVTELREIVEGRSYFGVAHEDGEKVDPADGQLPLPFDGGTVP